MKRLTLYVSTQKDRKDGQYRACVGTKGELKAGKFVCKKADAPRDAIQKALHYYAAKVT